MNGGGRAVGLCGIDNKLLEAKKIKDELGYVGTVTQVNNEIIKDAIKFSASRLSAIAAAA